MDHLQNVMGYFDQQQPLCAEHDRISKDLYKEFGVKAGLRDENGKGVLAGLTNISDIRAFQYVDGVKKPADGQLLYRGSSRCAPNTTASARTCTRSLALKRACATKTARACWRA